MQKRYKKNIFGKILVPIVYGCECKSALAAAQNVVGEGQVLLVGFVCMPEGESLSGAAVPAREVRQILKTASFGNEQMRASEVVFATHNPWEELLKVIKKEKPNLLILEWPCHFNVLQIAADSFIHPPCDIAIASGKIPLKPHKVMVSIRGGPYAELALRLGLAINRNQKAEVTSLHITPVTHNPKQDAPFRSLNNILVQLPEIKRKQISTDDPINTILKASRRFDLVVLGATARLEKESSPVGPLAESILKGGKAGVIVVKTKRPAPTNFESLTVGHSAISVLVDKWFAENTYHADEFRDLENLLELKRKQAITISLALPALNEEETIGNVIQIVRDALMGSIPLLDEIVLIDSNSSDRTRDIARSLDVPVYIHQELLNKYGARKGKGEALWKSLSVTKGDIILWIDTDIVNIQPHFVYGLIGPLLLRPEIMLVKGFYQRPLKVDNKLQAGGGGRVTELTARPLLNLFYPELSGLIQPLAGEYGGRRVALEKMPFSSGYGVEIGLLIDILDAYGVSTIAQVDLQERIHHNQSLESLSKMSFTIIQTVIHKLEKRFGRSFLEEVNRSMKLIRYEPGRFFLEVEEIAEQERPPMIDIPEYSERYII